MTDNNQELFLDFLQNQLQKSSALPLSSYLLTQTISGREINNALMDFGALVSTTFDKLDKTQYPLQDCLWFQSE